MTDHGADAPPPAAETADEPRLVRLYTEKVRDHGEDSEPIAMEVGSAAWAVGVLDGLGGAGATPVKTEGGTFSSAYVASRVARESVCAVLNELASAWATHPLTGRGGGWSETDWLRARLAERIYTDLRRVLDEIGGAGGRVRGASIRPLPTTLALGLARDRGAGSVEIDALWAGDSRVYLLEPRTGLHQLSADDLKSGGDAMRNLSDDGPMSNLLSADGNFTVNHCRFEVRAPVVLLAATDGCFGYLRTPAHFEELLLDSMVAVVPGADTSAGPPATADPWRAWRSELRTRIALTTGDDATMAIGCFGWPDFTAMTADFAQRAAAVGELVDAVDQLAEKHTHAVRAVKLAEQEYDRARSGLWSAYRAEYESLLPPRAPSPPRLTAAAAHARLAAPEPAPEPAAPPARHGAPARTPEPAGSDSTGSEPAVADEPGAADEESATFPPDQAVSSGRAGGADDLTALSDVLTERPLSTAHTPEGGGR